MKTTSLSFLVSGLVLVSLSGCTTRNDQMEAQLLQHDAQIRQMQPVQADAWNQVQALREEVADLRGQIADLRKVGGAGVIVDKLNRHDQALRQVETSMALQFDLGEPIGSTGRSQAATAPQAQLSPTTAQAAQSSPTYGGLVGAGAGTAAATAAQQAPSASTWGQATPRPKAQKAEKDMSVALYDAGMNAFNARKYNEAQRSFSDYMQNFGSGSKAPLAQYYLAECYFQKNQFSDAALAYDVVITKYPDSSKAAGAYLKQGICFSKLKQTKAARARMNDLIKKYPNSPEAARAKDFLKTNS